MGIIISMNDKESYYRTCESCGRPMAYCKGQCCGQPKGCSCQEYGPMKAGCLREIEPSCPYQAVIPTLTVEDKSNLKDLADCFVHVSNINTTFYIDDKHRTIVTWAGPVEYDNYDLDANSLGLRSQFLIDHANDYAAYYNKTGEYQKFNFSEGDTTPTVRLSVEWASTADWTNADPLDVMPRFIINDVYFLNEETQASLSAGEVFALLETGTKVILDHVPLGAYYTASEEIRAATTVDGVDLSTKVTDLFSDDVSPWYSYTGGAFVMPIDANVSIYYGAGLMKSGSRDEYTFYVQGYKNQQRPN